MRVKRAEITVNPELITWAVNRSGLSLSEFKQPVEEWIHGSNSSYDLVIVLGTPLPKLISIFALAGFWNALLRHHERSKVFSIDHVKNELTEGNDILIRWAK